MESDQETTIRNPVALHAQIYDRITKRHGERIRNLTVKIRGTKVHLGGECSTYYTKQLVQQAVLDVLENETVLNEIVVAIPSPLRDFR